MEDIATGAAVLGAGGGGDPYIGKLMAINAIREFGRAKLISASELRDDDLVIPTAMMGAPTVMADAMKAGAKEGSVQIVEIEEIPLSYLPGNAIRLRVKAAGELLL